MKKSLLTIAVAAGMVASSAAFADVKVYGHAQVEVASWGGDVGDGVSVEDNARGRVGFKSATDLGEGMKALTKFEFKVDTADGDADTSGGSKVALSKREMMIGLKTGVGQIELGRLKSAYKYAGGVKYDPYVATVLEARGNGGMSGKVGAGNAMGHNSFISDSFAYSHKMGAIAFRLTYDLDDGGNGGNLGTGVKNNAQGANAMSLSVKFSGKKWEAFVAIIDDDEDQATTGKDNYSSVKFGGQYKMGKAGKISVQVESAETDDGVAAVDTDIIYLDYQYKVGKNDIIDFAYGTDEDDVAGTDELTFTRLAYTHKLGKSTKTWIGYRVTERDIGTLTGDQSVISVGLQNRF